MKSANSKCNHQTEMFNSKQHVHKENNTYKHIKNRVTIFGTTLAMLCIICFSCTKLNSSEVTASVSSTDKDLALESQNIYGPELKGIQDLYYGIDTRFAAVKKSDIQSATDIYTFLNDDEKQQIERIKSVNLVVIKDNQQSEIQAYGTTDHLTDAQLEILKSMDYFNHFTIRTEFRGKNMETGIIEDKFFGPHITVVPDQQATYAEGNEALINYLKDNSISDITAVINNQIFALKISFVISKEGQVTTVKHDAMTTGYPSIDEKFIELIKNIPGKWIPAENAKGEKMEQEFVFTFGPADRC